MRNSIKPETLTKAAETVQSMARPLFAFLGLFVPLLMAAISKCWFLYQTLPKNVVKFWSGFVFCFFGGLYPVTFAAIQAAEHGGRAQVVESLAALGEEALVILEESKKDDAKDDDNDGIPDVLQISSREFAMRKFHLVVTKMDPKKVDTALATLYRVWLSVAAVLMVQFARTISLALSISDFIQLPMNRYVTPTIELATPAPYRRWVPVILGWFVKSIAMSIAWYIQTIISAVTSALIGAQMMAWAFYDGCIYHKWTLRGLIPLNRDETYLDEMLTYFFAALGIYVQFKMNFDVPFPYNLILWPLELIEYYLRWIITSK
jgi:hypothetical protein